MTNGFPRTFLIVPGGGFQLESFSLLKQLHGLEVELVLPSDNVEADWMRDHLIHRMDDLATRAQPTGWLVLWRLIRNFSKGALLLYRRRPDCIVCIGSSICLPIFTLAKIAGIQCIFIESMARVDGISKTGKLIERWRLASPIYVQWPNLVEGRSARIYVGTVL